MGKISKQKNETSSCLVGVFWFFLGGMGRGFKFENCVFTLFLLCLLQILEEQDAFFFFFPIFFVKEIQSILVYMNILGYFLKYVNCLCGSDLNIQHYLQINTF